jgi:hypothetical protein
MYCELSSSNAEITTGVIVGIVIAVLLSVSLIIGLILRYKQLFCF